MKCHLFSFLFISTLAFGQIKTEKYFFNQEFLYFKERKEIDSSSATFTDYYIYFDTIKNSGLIRTIDKDGRIFHEGKYSNLNNKIRNGISKTFYSNGQLKSVANYINNELDGELNSYYSSGQLKRKDYFKKGKFKKGKCYSSTGQDTIHFDFERMAEFPGGFQKQLKFLTSHYIYAAKAKENGIEGLVAAQFKVNEKGELVDLKIVKSVHPLLDDELIRVIKLMPKWTPGIHEGEAVAVSFTLPLRLKLE